MINSRFRRAAATIAAAGAIGLTVAAIAPAAADAATTAPVASHAVQVQEHGGYWCGYWSYGPCYGGGYYYGGWHHRHPYWW